MILRLNLSLRLTLGLIISFATGLICIGFAATLLATGFVKTSITIQWMVAAFEQTYAIIAACCPYLKTCCLGQRDQKLRWRGREVINNAVIESDFEKQSPPGSPMFNRDVTGSTF